MDQGFYEYLTEIDRVLSTIRASLEQELSHVNPRGSLLPEHPNELEEIYIRFERVRLRFRNRLLSLRRGGPVERHDFGFLDRELRRMRNELSHTANFRFIKMKSKSNPFQAKLFGLHPALYSGQISVHEAIELLASSLHEMDDFRASSQQLLDFEFDAEPIRRVVPKRQGIGPVRFDIAGNRIVIQNQPAVALDEDRSNTRSAKDALVDSGSKIIGELERSNCDRRLLENFRDLQQQLESETDIVKLGLANIGTEMMAGSFSNELPEAVLSMVRSQNVGIGMYVSQFGDWQRFAEKAASVDLSVEAIGVVHDTAAGVIKGLLAKPEMADPEVPRTLKALNDLIENPKKASKRAAYAVWRSIENLVIKIFNFGTDFFSETSEKLVDKGSTAVARAAVAALMTLAMVGAVGLSPVASQVPSSKWLSKAAEIVQKQIEKIE